MHDVCYTIDVRCECETDYECGDSWTIAVAKDLETAKKFVREIETDDPIYMDRVQEGLRIIADEVFYPGNEDACGLYRRIRYEDEYDSWVSSIYITEMEFLP